ncbi:MAG: GWxTD domain-containing protein [Candidatus Stahlbacteria bacterium]|nr:GWxTD domain-containing protein [Candidatus Stahlbacteria bacterium]
MILNIILFCSLIPFTVGMGPDINFNFTTATFLSPDKSTELRILYTIPCNELTFIKQESVFVAKFRISCSLQHKNKEIGDMWVIENTIKDYESTKSKTNKLHGILKLRIPPNDYKLRLNLFKMVIQDLNSQRKGEKSAQIRVKEIKEISEIISYEEPPDIVLFFEVYNFVPINRNTMFDSLPIPAVAGLEFIPEGIRGLRSQKSLHYEIGKIKDTLKLDTTVINPITLKFHRDSLGFGTHFIYLALGENKFQDSVVIEAPFWYKDYEKRVQQLHYIAETEEIDSLLKTPVNKREDLWSKFWVCKDSIFRIGAQELETEYFNRVNYANEQFTAVREGWKTDRGRIYVKLGNPSEISRYPFELDSKPYEIWYYYAWNLQFVFIDKQGFGDYTLEQPVFWDERIRFR